MKALLITIILLLLCALVGWISYSNSESAATLRIDKQEIKQDTKAAAEEIQNAAERAVDATREAVGGAEEETHQRNEEAPELQGTP